jgi:ribonuclease T2
MKASVLVIPFAIAALLSMAAVAQHHHSRPASHGEPGAFDYYLLTLSWSPEFCHCSNAPGLAHPEEMSDIMPDVGLVAHEWSTHGTCTGLDASRYFGLLRRAFAAIKIPEKLANARENFSAVPEDLKGEFVRTNPNFTADEMTISCGNNYLTAVSFCLSKELKPIACQNLRDCRANVIRVPRIP